MALNCEIAPFTVFDRKNYFYPDMPKNYQISQYDMPIGGPGMLDIEADGRPIRIGVTRVHLEEDTGKSLHIGEGGRIQKASHSLEDFNRAGTPLVEIVTEPDLRSAEAARLFATELRAILEQLEVSDVRMEEGSMRVDANISVAPPGLRGVKAEVKNMNSLKSLERALAYEQGRQSGLIQSGQAVEQSTRHWDEKLGITAGLRSKEEAFDYRYLREPDMVPIEPSVEWLRQLREEIPELPAGRRKRLQVEAGLSTYDAGVITSSKALGDFYESARAVAKHSDAKQVANWVTNEFNASLSERSEQVAESLVTPQALARLADLVSQGAVSKNQGKKVFSVMAQSGRSPDQIIEEEGLRQVSDVGSLAPAIEQVIAENPEIVARIEAGEDKPFGFLVGQVMKATKGSGNPGLITGLLRERLGR